MYEIRRTDGVDAAKRSEQFWGPSPKFAYGVEAFKGSESVGFLLVYRRALSCSYARIDAAGIGRLWVHEDYRKDGIATRLLLGTCEIMIQDAQILAVLISRKRTLYARIGFGPMWNIQPKNNQCLWIKPLFGALDLRVGWTLQGGIF